MATVTLTSLAQLRSALVKLGVAGEQAVTDAMRKSARNAVREIRETSRTTSPRPWASGDYETGWKSRNIPRGAEVINTSGHAYYVEVGRKPGKMPPESPIVRWLIAKGIAKASTKGRAAKAGSPSTRALGTGGPRLARAKTRRVRGKAMDVFALALAIRRKIAKHGTAGRFVVQRAMPEILRFQERALRESIRRLCAAPPRA